ncbi:MAG: hypothetical protein H6815_01310 [Phycisphaeraceae bacterium]|nr:hypothetical protein [Phycisphaerales bacterium]MCB9859065.1 hypothetical protein [Phycisphaeraceae bacterium]
MEIHDKNEHPSAPGDTAPRVPSRRELRGSRLVVLVLLVIGPFAVITGLMWLIAIEIPKEQRDANRKRMEEQRAPAIENTTELPADPAQQREDDVR